MSGRPCVVFTACEQLLDASSSSAVQWQGQGSITREQVIVLCSCKSLHELWLAEAVSTAEMVAASTSSKHA